MHELEFLKICRNHAELASKLNSLGLSSPDVFAYAQYVCACWFELAEVHLQEAKAADAASCPRAAMSRAYYAAYNASKAARYIVKGAVSLKGDDHSAASAELPDDLPDVEQWAQDITVLYEHRLRADYDHWADTQMSNTLTTGQAITLAERFIDEVRGYVNGKFGHTL
ncbi:MAG TPA: HEPN domain-containing protein [Acidobacteriaceae bacterium]